jgi:hypothetical protein
MGDCALGEFRGARVREDVEGLEICDAEGVREVDLDVEAEGAEDALFG